MRILKKNFVKLGLCAAIGVGFLYPSISSAGYNEYGFEFTIKPQQGNSRSEGLYRSTTNRNDAWLVNVNHSGEGYYDFSTFWLENSGGTNVSPSRLVSEADPNLYTKAYDNASQTTVYLTAENNNYNNTTYGVNGYWDEETGNILN
ncbi:MAG: DUF2712 domain-containing protein [Bacillota bacterium]